MRNHDNETQVRPLVIGESEFIFCRCYYDMFPRAGDRFSRFLESFFHSVDWSIPTNRSQVKEMDIKKTQTVLI